MNIELNREEIRIILDCLDKRGNVLMTRTTKQSEAELGKIDSVVSTILEQVEATA
jgi:hypothetical protein